MSVKNDFAISASNSWKGGFIAIENNQLFLKKPAVVISPPLAKINKTNEVLVIIKLPNTNRNISKGRNKHLKKIDWLYEGGKTVLTNLSNKRKIFESKLNLYQINGTKNFSDTKTTL